MSLTFHPHRLYLHYNASLHLTEFLGTRICTCISWLVTPEVYTLGLCRQTTAGKHKQTVLYLWLDSEQTKCQIAPSQNLTPLIFICLPHLLFIKHDHINYNSAKCQMQVEMVSGLIVSPGMLNGHSVLV